MSDFRMLGLSELRRDLNGLAHKIRDAVPDAAEETGEQIVRTAVSLVPVDTGELRDSIQVTRTSGGVEVIALARGVYPEFGTSDTPAQPYLGPAVDNERRRYPDRVAAMVRKRLA